MQKSWCLLNIRMLLTSDYWRIVSNFDLFTLRELLRNVTLILPEDLELIVGLRPNNVYMYYGVVEAIMFADVHSFKLVLNVPLETVDNMNCTKWLYYLRAFQIMLRAHSHCRPSRAEPNRFGL